MGANEANEFGKGVLEMMRWEKSRDDCGAVGGYIGAEGHMCRIVYIYSHSKY